MRRSGYIALLSVLIVSAIAAMTVLILFVTSVSSTLNSGNVYDGHVSRVLADACVELALQRITDNESSPCTSPTQLCGAEVQFSTGMCKVFSITDLSDGTDWRIRATGSGVSNATNTLLEVIAFKQTGSAAVITTWRTVSGFSP